MTGWILEPVDVLGQVPPSSPGLPIVATPSLSPPFHDPVVIFGLAMFVFLAAPLALQRYRLPGILGIILVGAAIGPNGLHLLERDQTFVLLGEVGLIYLMFVAGLEIDFAQFVASRDQSAVFGLLTFLIPQAAGTAVGVWLLDLSLPAASLYAAIFASHTLLAYPVVNRLGIVKNEAITAAIGGTILTDTLALLVLAVVVAAHEGVLDAAFWVELGGGLALFFVGVWVVVPRISRWFFRTLHQESYYEFLFVMVVLFVAAFLAELVGVEHIVGAFLAGLVLNRLIPSSGPLMNRIEFVGNALFIPFFLLSVGMLVDVSVLVTGPETVVIAGSLVVLVLVTKLAAAWLTGRLYGYSRDEWLGMFGLSLGQAAAALAIVLIGFDAGIPGFDQHMVNGVVVMILVVSLVSPAVVQRAGAAIARTERHQPYDPSDAPRRVLVPVSNQSEYWESLLDLAMAVREAPSADPLHTLSVVQPGDETETEAAVAEAEEMQASMAEYAAGADVPLLGHTRVDHNVASGIVTAAVENRISTVVIGWDGAASREQRVFGHVIDQVLHRAPQLTLVSRIREPLGTTRRIRLVLPPGIDHNAGFAEALHACTHLAEQVGAPVHALLVDGDSEGNGRADALDRAEVSGEFESVAGWTELRTRLRETTREGDLVVCLSARRTDPSWHSALQTLPKDVSTLTDGNFVVVYPARADRADDRQFLRFE
jgi:Kef-type K+ transport system membrane component KefB/nucleotide-binding universal stress UspA family protein